eukprot:1628922-Amphidinium_carterae.1
MKLQIASAPSCPQAPRSLDRQHHMPWRGHSDTKNFYYTDCLHDVYDMDMCSGARCTPAC